MTQHYIGSKQVLAWPADGADGKGPGYGVGYPDGYQSWSPKEVFERHYLPMGEGANPTTISQTMVDSFIAKLQDQKIGDKTTMVTATLLNGFEITETSTCVDPANYSHLIGVEVCLKRIKDKAWMLLGFLLQTARYGVDGKGVVREAAISEKVAPPLNRYETQATNFDAEGKPVAFIMQDRVPDGCGSAAGYALRNAKGHLIDSIIFQRRSLSEFLDCWTNEAIVAVLIDRIRGFQNGDTPNEFNIRMLEGLEITRQAMSDRIADRKARGVLGTKQA